MNWNVKTWNWVQIRNEVIAAFCIFAVFYGLLMLWAAQDLPSDHVYFAITDDTGEGWHFSGQDAQYHHTDLNFTVFEGRAVIKNSQPENHYLVVNNERVDSFMILPGDHISEVQVFAITGEHILTTKVFVHMANQP